MEAHFQFLQSGRLTMNVREELFRRSSDVQSLLGQSTALLRTRVISALDWGSSSKSPSTSSKKVKKLRNAWVSGRLKKPA